MKVKNILKTLSTTVSKIGFVTKKNSPAILAVTGVIGVVAGTVMACKATMKVEEILEEKKGIEEDIRQMEENNEDYTAEDAQKDRRILMVKTGAKFVKLYAPAAIIILLSLFSILASNRILSKRYTALATAYTMLNKDFKDYRARTVERFGEEVDKQLRYNLKSDKITEEVTDEEGKTKKVKKSVDVGETGTESIYMKYYTKTNDTWIKDPQMRDFFFNQQQRYANDALRTRGHITLNEVYDLLGFQHTKAGFVVGWIYDEHNSNGDNYVDFKIKETYLPNEDGDLELCYAIDFNVDGVIYDKFG